MRDKWIEYLRKLKLLFAGAADVVRGKMDIKKLLRKLILLLSPAAALVRKISKTIAWKVRQPFVRAAAAIRRKIENSILYRMIIRYPLVKRFLTEIIFRSGVLLYFSLLLNFAYGALQILVGLYSRSIWLGALAVYHVLLAVMQFRLSKYIQRHDGERNGEKELRLYRFCGIALIFMTPIFASILIQILHKNSRFAYPGFLIYFAAVFAFIKIGTAVSSAVKFRKYGSPVLSAIKTLSLVAAMISILSLETAVISRYGNTQSPVFYQGMLGTVGGAVCVFTLSKAVYMVAHASQLLKAGENRK